jgi:hypothetical protein
LRAVRLDHGNALGVNGGHQDHAGGGSHRALLVKGVEILGGIRQDLFQAMRSSLLSLLYGARERI